MSFRSRLTLFFVLVVVVPMISVAIVLFGLISDNQTAKVDAELAAHTEMVINLYEQARRDARRVFPDEDKPLDPQLSEALREEDGAAARERAAELAERPITRIRLVDEDGEQIFTRGEMDAIIPATGRVKSPGGDSIGRLEVSVTRAPGFKRRVQRLAGTGLVVRTDSRLLDTSVDGLGVNPLPDLERTAVPGGGTLRVGTIERPEGKNLRVAALAVPGFGSERLTLGVLDPIDKRDVTGARLLAGAILLAFLILALAFALAVSRQLQQQIAALLEAARRIGRGDFSIRVPTEGSDEFAALGAEFNNMSEQLAARLEELRRERERVQGSVRRLGQAVGANLDRPRLLEIVVAAALEGVGAQGGRVMTPGPAGGPPTEEAARAGELDGRLAILGDVEERVLRSGTFAEVRTDGDSALGHPLFESDDQHQRISGVVSVARSGEPFNDADRELFQYLAGQAAVSVENLHLHEAFEREAVTDELTGLSNRRRFYDAVELEVERSRRFGDPVGLVMVDLDDFKAINDTRGHLQGDEVLRQVARVLRESSRDIDEPARYGGEELAIVLRTTDLEGADTVAERVRTGIEALEVSALDGGRPVRLTASCGVASLPEAAASEQDLLAAADGALLRAKRSGKNRTVRAPRII